MLPTDSVVHRTLAAPFLLVVLAGAACGGSPGDTAPAGPTAPDEEQDPRSASSTAMCSSLEVPGSGDREALFRALTATTWSDAGCASSAPLAPTCTRLELRPDGTYAFGAVSDYTERADEGRWSFAASGERSGVVCLDGAKATPARRDDPKNVPSALAFTVEGGRLTIGAHTFAAGQPAATAGSLSALGDVHLPIGYARLLGEWTKSNVFDLSMQATELRFDRGGRFLATHRTGCSYGGTFSWDKGIFTPASDPNACDERGATTANIAAANDVPEWDGDLLLFYASSYRKKGAAGPDVFYFDPYSHELRVRGELEGSLKKGVETRIRLRLDNRVDRPRTLESLTVKIASVTPAADGNGYSLDGELHVLATRDFAGAVVAANGSRADEIAITPDVSGERVYLDFAIAYRDDRQPWKGSRSYLARVEP